MIVQDFLHQATEALREAGIPTPRLDCLVLLEDALGLDRAAILAHPETPIGASKIGGLNKEIAQRVRHTPLAYIRGKTSFYGRKFAVNRHVLVPRPESETMIDVLKKLPLPPRPKIVDIGTGTGCLGVTAALELGLAKVTLYDIDPQALKLAKLNARALKTNVTCRRADLLAFSPEANIILANLPYVPERYAINQAAEHEPKHAIFGGKDGLNLYRRLWSQINDLPHKPRLVLTEALPPQHTTLAAIAGQAGYTLHGAEDFIQVFKLN